MDFTHLREHYQELLNYLEEEGYSKNHIKTISQNIYWILKNEKSKLWQSYQDIYHDRGGAQKSESYKRGLRVAFGAIEKFDLQGKYPNRRASNGLIKRGAYYKLVPEFKEAIDYYRLASKSLGTKESSVNVNASAAAVFLHAMQEQGLECLGNINETDVLAFFLDAEGNVSRCGSYKRALASVFRIVADLKENECKNLIAYLPQIRTRRKNIQYLTPEEVESIREVLDDEGSSLTFKERAIGKLLFFTGMRACDIAGMELGSIDWENEEIYLSQQKTDEPLVLPLTVTLGNSVHDYLANERPKGGGDRHLFISEDTKRSFGSGAVWHYAAKIYKEAAIRQSKGDRRGTHLFRHNAATSFLANGVPRPVISQTLGQIKPQSLNQYLHTDFVHLKECALSIEGFPADEGVFGA